MTDRLAVARDALEKIENEACRGLDEGESREAVIDIKFRAREALAALASPPDTAQGEPVAWRVRVMSDDPEEWSLLPAGGGADYRHRFGYECQPLYNAPPHTQAEIDRLREENNSLTRMLETQAKLYRQALSRAKRAEAAQTEDPRWQKLRDLFGLDGWHDGVWHAIPSPDQIITHVEFVANERARLMAEAAQAKYSRPSSDIREQAWKAWKASLASNNMGRLDVALDAAFEAAQAKGGGVTDAMVEAAFTLSTCANRSEMRTALEAAPTQSAPTDRARPVSDEDVEVAKAELFKRGLVNTFSVRAALEAVEARRAGR